MSAMSALLRRNGINSSALVDSSPIGASSAYVHVDGISQFNGARYLARPELDVQRINIAVELEFYDWPFLSPHDGNHGSMPPIRVEPIDIDHTNRSGVERPFGDWIALRT